MVYVTGDMHGDITRFDDKKLRALKRGDVLIVCGDFGFIWNGGSKEKKILSSISHNRFTTVFVDGTHENFDLLYRYPVAQWNGGKVHKIASNVFHLCRGEIFDIDGISVFAMGGGENNDVELRQQRGEKWWEEECPTLDEMRYGVENLYNRDLKVDYIITHEPPSKIKQLLNDKSGFNQATAFFDELVKECTFKHWYFGSTHQNVRVSSIHTSVFDCIVPLTQPEVRL